MQQQLTTARKKCDKITAVFGPICGHRNQRTKAADKKYDFVFLAG